MSHAYLGPSFSSNEIENCLIANHHDVKFTRSNEVEKDIAKLIHEGSVVGRFNGRAEWGPRALGNRSILLKPTEKTANDTVNQRLNRSEFMPFAPSVIDVQAGRYFENYDKTQVAAEYMTMTYNVFEDQIGDIEAVVHVDNTARPQIVRKETNPSYYKILEQYLKLSGNGCIVNTSFNLHEEPIVNSPEDALRALRQGAVDVLAIGDFLVRKV